MKKLIAMILALMMIGSLALAEDAGLPQEQLAFRFQNALQRTFQQLMQMDGEDVVLDVQAGGTEQFSARLQQKNETVSLKVRNQSGGQEALIQVNEEGIWALINGQAVGLRFSDLQSMTQMTQMPQVDSRIYEVIFQLLADETVMKGIEITGEGAATIIKVNLEAKALLEGFVRWMDDVLQVPQCREAVVSLFDRLTSASGTRMNLEEQWPSIREDLLAVETDAKITGEISAMREAGGYRLNGTLTYTEGRTEYGLAFNAMTGGAQPKIEATLSGNGGYGEVKDLAALRLTSYVRTGNFRAELEQIQDGSTIVLNGVAGDESLQLDLSGYPQDKVPLIAHLYIRSTGDLDDGFEVRLDATDRRNDFDLSSSLTWNEGYQSFHLRAEDEEISFVAQEDRTGKLVYASLLTPQFEARYEAGSFVYRDRTSKVTVTSTFESGSVNVLDVVTESRYSSEPVHMQVRTEILTGETGDGSITGTVLDAGGNSMAAVTLRGEEQEELPMISEMNPMMLTPELIQQMTGR